MGKFYLGNAFSLQMVQGQYHLVRIEAISLEEVKALMANNEITSVVGHQATADVITNLVGVAVVCNRANITLDMGDTLIVAQVEGGRLPEGATTLPEGVTLSWRRVRVVHPCDFCQQPHCGGGCIGSECAFYNW